jgi:peptidoglycan/xylan/chitin deacetylase (PgdA/CDA1 family)
VAAATTVLLASVFALAYTAPAGAATPNTIVSLGFDDGFANAYTTAAPILASHGMQGTYFIISQNVGSPGYMTWSQIAALASAGNEIAGHTFTHPDLATLTPTQVRQEVCSNRSDLLSRGFQVTDFAYPFGTLGTINAQDEQIVRECGYNSARTSLWYGAGCGSPCTESLPPTDPYWTTVIGWGEQGVATLEQEVTAAEAYGGWAQIVFHGVCDPLDPTCDTTNGTTDPATLSTFLDWLKLQVANGSVAVRTIQQVIGGPVQPLVQPPVLSGAPSATTSSTSASISFTGETGATFTCSVDGGTSTACSSPNVLSGLSNGAHTFAVEQTDTAGDVSTAASAAWTIDTSLPAPPVLSGAPPAKTNSRSASIGFTGLSGATFTCSLDGGTYATCSSPKALSGLADGTHSLAVKQTNAFGTTSAAATASWTIDTTIPAPPVLSGVPPAQTNTTTASIAFAGLSGATFTCSADGGTYATCSSPELLTGLADGSHTLAVKQTNTFGTTSVAATASWTVDTVAPAPPVLSGAPAAQTNTTAASINFIGESGASFSCSVDGGTYTACSSPKVLTGLADGTHSLAVKQTDLAGNNSPAATASWTIDTTVPAPPLLSGVPPAQTNTTTASISFAGLSGATYTCSVDGGTYAACSSPKVLSGLADGAHSLAVKQTNVFGTTSAKATASWTIDTTVPAPPVLSGVPPAQTNAPTASIGLAGLSGATFTCSLDGGPYGACSSPTALTGLADGSHTLAVKQTNVFGTTSAAATASWTIDTTVPAPPVLSGVPPAQTNITTASIDFAGLTGAMYVCSVDGGPYVACSSPGVFSGLADGAHSLAVKQTNVFGTTSAPATASWTVDTIAPAPPVLSGVPPAQTNTNTASISFTGENGATFTCSIDGGAFTVCSSAEAMTGLADGAHSLAVRQTDGAGNVSAAATAVWTVVTPAQSGTGGNGSASGTSTPPTSTPPTSTPPTSTPPSSIPQASTSAAWMGLVGTRVGRNGDVRVVLACQSSASAPCQGSVSVRGASVAGSAGRSGTAKIAAFGRATYTIQPGKRLTLTLHLSKNALKLLAHRHTLKVTLVLRSRNGRVIYRRTLTLHASKK